MQGRTGMKDNGKKMENKRGNMNKKFWEEQVAYFPLIRHGPHRTRRLQQFFVAGGTSLPELLPGNYKGIHRHTRPTVHLLLRVFVAVETCVPSRYLATIRRNIHAD
jgi:hypothetical protein